MFYFPNSLTYNNETLVSFHVLWYKLQKSEAKDFFPLPIQHFQIIYENLFYDFFPNFVNFDKFFALTTFFKKQFLNIQYFPLHICVS